MAVVALIVAAGQGIRAGGGVPKQYRLVGARPLICHSIERFAAHPSIAYIRVVIGEGAEDFYINACEYLSSNARAKLGEPIIGGETRQKSVHNGLESIARLTPSQVLIHDAARPFITQDIIERLLDVVQDEVGAIAALPIADSLKRGVQFVSDDVDRSQLWSAHTPQAFMYDTILDAHRKAEKSGRIDFTDDAGIATSFGYKVKFTRSHPNLFKVTEPEDFHRAEQFVSQQVTDFRTGQGFDVHRLIPGEHMWLCGIQIEAPFSLEGHSDADVALHALTDAALGTIAAGDIGDHFPPSDPEWKGARSDQFLIHAKKLIAQKGGFVNHCDLTIMCEAPKIGPHKAAMKERIAAILQIDESRVSVKATTTEKLGFTGRGEGIAALATMTVGFVQNETSL